MKRLLIVDDSPVVRGIVVRVLREAGLGYDGIVEAGCGADALRRIGTDPTIGLVLSDADIPGMDGLEFLRTLRERRTQAELPVLLLTAGDVSVRSAATSGGGANGWLQKPFTADTLRAAVEPWLARSER